MKGRAARVNRGRKVQLKGVDLAWLGGRCEATEHSGRWLGVKQRLSGDGGGRGRTEAETDLWMGQEFWFRSVRLRPAAVSAPRGCPGLCHRPLLPRADLQPRQMGRCRGSLERKHEPRVSRQGPASWGGGEGNSIEVRRRGLTEAPVRGH